MKNEILEILEDMEEIEDECIVDALLRIDKEVYYCKECTVANTKEVVRKDDVKICPLTMKREVEILR